MVSPVVTIVVVSWNTRELLARCLASMAEDVRDGRAAVCVVDNRSSDGSAEMVERDFAWARLIRAGANLGFGAAVNLGATSTSRTPWVAPCNADTALEAGSLRRLLQAGADAGRPVAVAPMLIGADGAAQHSAFAFPGLRFTVLFNLGLHRVSRRWGDRNCIPGLWDPRRRRWVPWAVGAFLLVDRQAWDDVGGFDSRQWMYAEDLDLGWRLHRVGVPTLHEPDARVLHAGSAAVAQIWDEDHRVERWMAATYAWMLRRRGAARTRAVALVNVMGASARGLVFAILSRRDPERWSQTMQESRRWARVHRIGLLPRSRIVGLSVAAAVAPPAVHRPQSTSSSD